MSNNKVINEIIFSAIKNSNLEIINICLKNITCSSTRKYRYE